MTQAEYRDDWIVSVDDHVIEPPDLWTSRLPQKYRDEGPRIVSENGADRWVYEDIRQSITGLVTSAGYGHERYNPLPISYADMEPYCYDATARLKAMDEDKVLASMVFPNFPRFCGQIFYGRKDTSLALLCVQAYNDFILDEWCATDPHRLIGAIIIPLWDTSLAAAEIERCAEKGARSVIFSEHPPSLGMPSIHDPAGYWDPVWRAATGTEMPISIHIGSSSRSPSTGSDAPAILGPVLGKWHTATTCADWMFCDTLRRFPDLRLAFSEGGIGWLPPLIESASYAVDHYKYNDQFRLNMDQFIEYERRSEKITSWPHDDMEPIDVFRKHMRGCFVAGLAAYADYTRDVISRYGSDLFLVEADFPHNDSSYPRSGDEIAEVVSRFSLDDQDRLRRDNAIDWFRFAVT